VKHPDRRLRSYRDLLIAEPSSVTSVREPGPAWALHVEDALAAADLVRSLDPAVAVDVGSGGGSPGIPLALALDLPTTLLEASARKCRFLERAAVACAAPCDVVHARSEDYARGEGRDAFPAAFARALAPPPVAAELVLPLVQPGGAAVLWTAQVDAGALSTVAGLLAASVEDVQFAGGRRNLVVLRKHGPTPERFPRRPGMARTRPLVPVPSSAT
jgi:16S rRNA (guanine527-N7)-methyltransferase